VEFRRTRAPLIGDWLVVVAEKFQVELVAVLRPHDLAHLAHERRLAIGGKPHDLVLVSVMGKAQVLSERLVEDT
jgi:hypothetical protein